MSPPKRPSPAATGSQKNGGSNATITALGGAGAADQTLPRLKVLGAGRTAKVYKTRIAESANPERECSFRETMSSVPAPTRLDDECRVLPQFANLVLWSSVRETTSSVSTASPAPPAPTSRFSRLRREPSTRATRAQIRAIFDVPHEPLPLKTVVGGGAFGTVYLVETSMGRIAVKQVRRWRANCGRSSHKRH